MHTHRTLPTHSHILTLTLQHIHTHNHSHTTCTYTQAHIRHTPQDFGATLIGEDGLMVMAGAESVEWYQIQQTHGFYVFDANPFAPLQTLL